MLMYRIIDQQEDRLSLNIYEDEIPDDIRSETMKTD